MNLKLLIKPAVYITACYVVFFLYIVDHALVYKEVFPTVVVLSNSFVFFILTWMVVLASAQLTWLLLSYAFFHRLNTAERERVVALFESKVVPIFIFVMVMRVVSLSFISLVALGAVIMRLLHTVAKERVVTLATMTEGGRTRFTLLGRLALFFQFSFVYSVGTMTLQYMLSPTFHEQDYFVYDVAWLLSAQHVCEVVYLTIRLVFERLYGEHRFISTLTYLEFTHHLILSVIVISYTATEFMMDRQPMYLIPVAIMSLESLFRRALRLWLYTDLTRMMRHLHRVTEEDLQQERRCIICYEDMTIVAACKRLPCGHCYHESCLLKWFRENDKCPYCRANPFKTLEAQRARERAAARTAVQQQQQQQQQQPPLPAEITQHAAPIQPHVAAAIVPRATNEPMGQSHLPRETTSQTVADAVSNETRSQQEQQRQGGIDAVAEAEALRRTFQSHMLAYPFPTQKTTAALRETGLSDAQRAEIQLKVYRDYVKHVEEVTQEMHAILQQLDA